MPRTLYVWAVLALLIGFTARVYRLGDANLWYDEGWSVFMARQTPAALLDETARDVHPPVYFLILSAWRAVGGESEFMLRFPSAVFGLVLIALGFRLTRAWFGTSAAVLAAFLLAVQGAGIWYSQEIRMYSLTMLLALIALGWAAELVATGRRRAWVGLTLTVAVGLHTLYLFVLVPAALSLALLGLLFLPSLAARRRLAGQWVTSMLAAGVLFTPWLLYAAARRPERFAEGGVADLGGMAALWLNTLLIGNAVNIDAYWPVYGAALGICLGAVVIARQADGRTVGPLDRRPVGQPAVRPFVRRSNGPTVHPSARLFVLLAALNGILATLALIWALSLPLGLQFNFIPTARYLITLVPWATLVLAVALAVWWARWPRAGLALGVVSVATLAAFASDRYADRVLADTFHSAARTWQAYRQPGDELVLHTDIQWPEVDYYLGGARHANIPNARTVTDPEIAAELVGPIWDAHDAVWLLVINDSLRADWDRNIWRWLDERAVASRSFDYGPDARLWVFARTPERAASLDQVINPPQIGTDIAISDPLRWVGHDRPLAEVQIGDGLQVVTYWQTASPMPTPGLGLRLASVWGLAVADEIPLAVPSATTAGLVRLDTAFPIRSYVSPGLYRLQLTAGLGGPVVGPDLALITVVPARPLPPGTALAGSAPEVLYENGLRISGWQSTIEGDRLLVEINYSASRILDRRWKRFVHLIGPDDDGRRWAQIDNEPLQAAPPMTAWPVEAVVGDHVTLVLPADLPAGRYRLITGFYDALTGTRLSVITLEGAVVGDSITLGTLSVPQK